MVLIYIFLVTREVEHFFICLLTICFSSFEKHLFKSFCLFFNCIIWVFLFVIDLYEFLVYFFTLATYQIYGWQIFSPSHRLPFQYIDFFLLLCRNFWVWCNLFFLFVFCFCLCFWCHMQKNIVQTNVKKPFPCFFFSSSSRSSMVKF